MAKYIKNDINFHGARSKTRVAENPSSNKKFSSKNKKMADDDGWGSIPNTSGNNNTDRGWGEVPSDGAIHKDTWENDRLVYGKSERNRKFRLDNNNSSFRVPIQSVPNWEEADTEFPSLGSHRVPPSNNVWEKRKRKQEEVASIAPSNETEEEMMIRQAVELSMKESKREEERRRELEEEYRLQMEILEANPDMFNEFRANQNEFPSSAGGSDNHSQENCPEEKVDYDQGAWGYSNKKATTKEKAKAKNEDLRKVKDDFPLLKPNSALPSFNGTTQTKNKVSQAVEMFGGWGTPKPFAQSAVVAKPPSKPSEWDIVDTDFVSLPSKKAVVEEKPIVKPSTPPSLEVKLENTTNWDSVDATYAKPASEAIETRNNLGTRDAVELNLKDAEPGYALDQKEKEFESQTKRKKPKAKLGRRVKEKENHVVPEENRIETSVSKVEHSTEVKGNDLVPEEDGSEIIVQKGDQGLYASCDRLSSEHSNQKTPSMEFQNIPQEKNDIASSEVDVAGVKSEFSLPKIEVPETPKSVQCDYAFLLNQIDVTNTVTNSEEVILNPPVEIGTSQNRLPEIYQTKFNVDNFLTETTSSEVLPIPEPVPFSIDPPSATNPNSMSANNASNINSWNEPNSNDMFKMPDAPPLRTFGGYPTNPESFNMAGDTSQTNLNEDPSLPTFGDYQPIHNMPVADNGASHIRGPGPEFANPGFFMQPRPVLAPIMNPAFMNPLMMQQMMMMSNPFFLQQLAQMDMYYKIMGMPVVPGMSAFQQPLPIPAFNAQNFQTFNPENMHQPCHNVTSGPTEQNEPIPSPIHRPANQFPEPNQPENVPPPTAEQPAAEPFWFEDYMSSDPVIPPPVPTSTRIPANPDNLPAAFSSMSLQGEENPAPSATNQGLPKESVVPDQPTYVPSQSPVATGWGEVNSDARSETSSGWNESVDGWGGSDTTTRSMRDSSRYVSENRANCRQPTSRPNLRKPQS